MFIKEMSEGIYEARRATVMMSNSLTGGKHKQIAESLNME
jgi:hypothetical protein